jgi:NADH-quinone oxidoreductase E subunit
MDNSNTINEIKPAEFSPEAQQEAAAIIARYPERNSAILPILHLAQREFGYITPEAEYLVADLLQRPVTDVHGVVTFYTMFNRKPVGKYHIQICRNISCWLKNAPGLLEHLKNKLGIDVGETSADGKFTLTEVECLAHCEYAPVLQINDEIIGNLTKEKIDQIIDDAK